MLFSSAIFLFIFLPVFLAAYYLVANRWKNALLFVASLLFYAWGEGATVIILLVSVGINFMAGNLIAAGHRRLGLALSLVGSLSLLFYYKYFHFVAASFYSFSDYVGLTHGSMSLPASVALPIGISFYTFQGISYTLDIYWGFIRANRSFLDYGTYIAMFPHQIAGPIVRYVDIAPELFHRKTTVETFGIGAERFIIGLAKKLLLANTFAEIADTVFTAQPEHYSTGVAWLGIIAYSFQIYYDFSGYSDMAIGLGKMLGFDFKENFDYPYTAQSIQDFWRRWHISLSSWFRDYVYIPLGGNRGSQLRTYRNLLIVFLVTGLWHGASWNFVFWGLYHGIFLMLERAGLGRLLTRLWPPLRHVYALLVILVGWVFFRATDLPAAFVYLQKMVGLLPADHTAYLLSSFINPESSIAIGVGCLLSMPFYAYFKERWSHFQETLSYLPLQYAANTVYAVALAGLFIISITYLAAGTYNPFIYFRF